MFDQTVPTEPAADTDQEQWIREVGGMRLVQWIDAWDRTRGGPVSVADSIARLMHGGGHEVAIATLQGIGQADVELGGARIHRVGRGPLQTITRRDRSNLMRLLENADCVHIHGIWEPSGLQVARLAEGLGIRCIVSLHGMLDDWAMSQRALRKRIFLAMLARPMLQRVAAAHCASDGEMRQAAPRIPGVPLIRIPQPIDLGGLPRADPTGAEPAALMLGRLHPVKGAEIAIEAIAKVRHSGRPMRLLMAGTGDPDYVQSLHALSARLGVENAIEWLGQLERSARAEAISRAMCAIAPTMQENFGVALFEALASGLPLVVSDSVDTRAELLESGGALVMPRDAESFADGLTSLHDDPTLRGRLGDSGRAWTLRWLDPDRLLERYLFMYGADRIV